MLGSAGNPTPSQAAPTRRSPAAVPPRAPQSARPARTARPEEPEAEPPSTSPNSRHRRSTNRLLVFQAMKRREEARGLSLSRILCRAVMQRLRASWIAASCSNTAPPAAVNPELDVAEPRQPSDTLAVAVHTAALKRRLPPCVPSTYGQCIQEGKANSRPRLDSNPRLGSPASSSAVVSSGTCPSGDSPLPRLQRLGGDRALLRKRKPGRQPDRNDNCECPRPSGRAETRAAARVKV